MGKLQWMVYQPLCVQITRLSSSHSNWNFPPRLLSQKKIRLHLDPLVSFCTFVSYSNSCQHGFRSILSTPNHGRLAQRRAAYSLQPSCPHSLWKGQESERNSPRFRLDRMFRHDWAVAEGAYRSTPHASTEPLHRKRRQRYSFLSLRFGGL